MLPRLCQRSMTVLIDVDSVSEPIVLLEEFLVLPAVTTKGMSGRVVSLKYLLQSLLIRVDFVTLVMICFAECSTKKLNES